MSHESSLCCFSSTQAMSLLCCSCSSLASARTPSLRQVAAPGCSTRIEQRYTAISTQSNALLGAVDLRIGHQLRWSFVGGSRILRSLPKVSATAFPSTGFRPLASWLTTSQIASNAFTWGTIVVLPFYTLMVVAPKATLTKRTMESSAPFIALGVLYAFLLYLSWSPDTLSTMFASKYWLPELSGIAKMFSNEITTASAWIHLLAIDLFAARQVFHDGLKSNVETRHSISLCLLFCPVGVFVHFVTKLLVKLATRSH